MFLLGMKQAADLSLGFLWSLASILQAILVWQGCFSRAGLQSSARIEGLVSAGMCDCGVVGLA